MSAFLRFNASPLSGLPASFQHSDICALEILLKKLSAVGIVPPLQLTLVQWKGTSNVLIEVLLVVYKAGPLHSY